jgi:rhodanese-related sulfurtransferase
VEIENITAEEAIALSEGESILLDVRERYEWDGGHAPTAVNIPLSEIQERVGELPEDADIVVICHSGGRSLTVTTALVDAGYSAVNVLGGMMAWERAGGTVVRPAAESPLN